VNRRRRIGAIHGTLERVQQMLHCVTAIPAFARDHQSARLPTGVTFSITLNNDVPARVRVRSGSVPLHVYVAQDYRIRLDDETADDVPPVSLIGYVYTLLASDGVEVVAYHWHPETTASLSFPHLHIGLAALGRDAAVLPGQFHKVHLPTGPVALEDFIRLAITEFGVEPRRADWADVLAGTQAARD
jgi:hypothetical protein